MPLETVLATREYRYQAGTSDKVYILRLVQAVLGYRVDYEFGRRGGTTQKRTREVMRSLPEAEQLFLAECRVREVKGYWLYSKQGMGSEFPAPVKVKPLALPAVKPNLEPAAKPKRRGMVELEG